MKKEEGIIEKIEEVVLLTRDPPTLKRRKRNVFYAAAGIVLVVSFFLILLTVLGIRIHFILNDDLQIQLSPLDVSLIARRNEPVNVSFTIEPSTFYACKSSCTYALVDLKDNSIFASAEQNISSGEKINKTYAINVDEFGTGQRLFSFNVACHNRKSFFCRTDENEKYKTSFITVNYELSEGEKKVQEQLQKRLTAYLERIQNVDGLIQKNRASLMLIQGAFQTVPEEIRQLEIEQELIDEAMQDGEKGLQTLVTLWNEEKYTELALLFSYTYEKTISRIEERSTRLSENIKNVVQQHNRLVHVFLEQKKAFNTLIETYKQEMITVNGTFQTDVLLFISRLEEREAALEENNIDSYDMLKKKISLLDHNLDTLTKKYDRVQQEENEKLVFVTALQNASAHLLRLSRNNLSFEQNALFLHAPSCERLANVHRGIFTLNAQNDKNVTSQEQAEAYARLMLDAVERIEKEIVGVQNKTRKNLLVQLLKEKTKDLKKKNTTYAFVSLPMETSRRCDNTTEITYFFQEKQLPLLTLAENITFTPTGTMRLNKPVPTCCVFNQCKPCCTFETCSENERLYPLIFIHGHAFNEDVSPEVSLGSFAKMQQKLHQEGYINVGELDLKTNTENISYGEYGKSGHPISIRVSYYYIQYFDLGSYTISTQKSEKIENYALRLKELIDLVKYRTGMKKVILVTHSMGGLVSREYIRLFGGDDVHKLMMIATPNKGIGGESKKWCTLFGSEKECEDLAEGSIFLKKLNNAETKKMSTYSLAISGCVTNGQDSDGVVTVESTELPFAKNMLLSFPCPEEFGLSLHTDILNPEKYPEVYEKIKGFLKE